MTAIVMIRTNDGILAAADGLHYDEKGVANGVGSKILMMPEHSTIITGQGNSGVSHRLRTCLGHQIDGFDDVLEDLPDALTELCTDLEERTGERPEFNLFVGGWSTSRERWESYFIRSFAPMAEGAYSMAGDPMMLHPASAYLAAPWILDEAGERFGLATRHFTDPGNIDPLSLAVRMIAAARHHPSEGLQTDAGRYVVGGFIQTALMGRDGCTSTIVHRWPDPFGEVIDPARGDALPAWILDRPVCIPAPSQERTP